MGKFFGWCCFAILFCASAETKKPCSANGLSQVLERLLCQFGDFTISGTAHPFRTIFCIGPSFEKENTLPGHSKLGIWVPPNSIRIARGFLKFQNEDLVRLILDPDAAVGVTMRRRMKSLSLESYIEARILMLLLEIFAFVFVSSLWSWSTTGKRLWCCHGEE